MDTQISNVIFNSIFFDKKNEDLLKWLLETCLNKKIDEITIIKEKIKLKQERTIKYLKVIYDDTIHYVDIHHGETRDSERDLALTRLALIYYQNKDEENEKFPHTPIYLHINLLINDDSIPKEDLYTFKNEENKPFKDNFIFYEVNLDKVKEEYNKTKKEILKPLVMLVLKDNELKELSESDERIKKYLISKEEIENKNYI